MDMLAQFFATNYALYTSATSQGRRGMFYPPMACHPSHLPFLTPQAASAFRFASRIQNLPVQSSSQLRGETQRDPQESNRDGVKFSIDNILNDKNKTEEREESSKDNGEDEECVIEEDDEDEDSNKFSWLQCTRYKPPKLPRIKRKDGTKKRKLGRNPRVPFTQHQVAALEQKFRRTHYLSSMDVAELSAALNLTETRVKIWFQNRRARERRDRDAIQRGQVIQKQTTSIPVPGTSWSFPGQHTSTASLTQYRESFPTSNSAFTPVTL